MAEHRRDFIKLALCGMAAVPVSAELKDEQKAYEAWFDQEIERAKSYGGRVILASHIPPFAATLDEKDSYDNHPRAGRRERLERYVTSGARFMLTAHRHRMAAQGYKSLSMLGAEALCDNFDMRPPGFRIFEVAPDFSYSWNFVEV